MATIGEQNDRADAVTFLTNVMLEAGVLPQDAAAAAPRLIDEAEKNL